MDIAKLDPNDSSQAWTAKIDGAHTYVKMEKGETPQLFSHRISKRSGLPIPYNPKLLHIKSPSPVTARLRGETYAVDSSGKAVGPDTVTRLLNSGTDNSLALQKELGLRTRTALIDIDEVDGHDAASWPFREKRRLMAEIVAKNPDFTLPAMATTPAAKQKLRDRIVAGKHPQTVEGLVVHELEGPGYGKAPLFNPHDVYVCGVFNEEGTKPSREKGLAGGFTYSWEPDGPIAGKVGTGFNHAMKREMAANPEKFIGKAIKVRALRRNPTGALVKPSFMGFHVEKNIEELR